MLRTSIRAISLVGILLILSNCQNFKRLDKDLDALGAERFRTFGTLQDQTQSGDSLMILYLGDAEGSDILYGIPMEKPGNFELWLTMEDGWLFAFADTNGDNRFQPEESYGWANGGRPLSVEDIGDQTPKITIQAPGSRQGTAPSELAGKLIYESARLQFAKLGELAQPSDTRFSEEAAIRGMWQPYTTLHEGNTGVFFTEPYDPHKVPVLFVHGITGFPAQFSDLIDSLDRDTYQAWFMNYPSGFYLPSLGDGLFRALEQLRRRFGFTRMHLVAHSMGGLVSQSYVQNCHEEDACEYLETFISISSPFGGMDSATSGVEHAPEVVPAWRNLAPGNPFLEALFDHPLPASTRHYLMFSYHIDASLGDRISVESSDSVVPLRSQLRGEAQDQATRIAGFDETHVGVLSDPGLLEAVREILESRDE